MTRRITWISMVLLASVLVALVFYAYPSWSGFLTVAARAAMFLVGLAILAFVAAIIFKRRPARWDIVFAAGAIGLVVVSWSQIQATADANKLTAEINSAGEENALDVVRNTTTKAGSMIRAAFEARDRTNSEVEPLLDLLWDHEILAIITGPEAEDLDRLADASTRIDQLAPLVDETRTALDAAATAEFDDLATIDTGALPDNQGRSIINTAIAQSRENQAAFGRRLDLAAARVEAARRATVILAGNQAHIRYDQSRDFIEFIEGGGIGLEETGRVYRVSVEAIVAAGTESTMIAADQRASRTEQVLALVEAARAAP